MLSDHAKLQELFLAACDLSDTEQQAFLDEQCAEDPGLRFELQRLLSSDAQENGLFANDSTTDGIQFSIATAADSELPERVGRYRVKRLLGQGGMGVVYLAEQQNPVRDIAIKVIRPGMVTPELAKRFELEAAVLGRLAHPCIAKIYEAGSFVDSETGQKRPFLAMEYIQGQTLRVFVQQTNPTTRDRLKLLGKICEAVNHAHQRGVIHRDLKPSNILVQQNGQPSILDFGVARATGSDSGETALRTRTGQLIGTLLYMSPEQVAGSSLDVDTRSDVYALGVIAYEMLSGKLPYQVDDSQYLQTAKAISEQSPVALSSVDRQFQGDLNTIVLKALEKEPQHRYQSASELADDINRYLKDQPIEAAHTGWVERNWRWCRRNRLFAALLASVATLVLAVAVISSISVVRLRAAAVREKSENQIATRRLFGSYLDQAKLRRLSNRPGQRVESLKALEQASTIFHTLDWKSEEKASYLQQLRSDTIESLSSLDLREVKSWKRPSGLDKVQFDAKHEKYAMSYMDGTIEIRDVETNQLIHEWAGPGADAWRLGFSPGGGYFAATFHTKPRFVRVWDMSTGAEVLQHDGGHTNNYAFSPNDERFANFDSNWNIQIFSLSQPDEPLTVLKPSLNPNRLFFRPDGAELAVARFNQHKFELWNLETEMSQIVPTDTGVFFVDWDSGSQKIAAGCNDGTIRVWNVDEYEQPPVRLTGHTSSIYEIDFNRAGTILYSRSWDSTARFWNLQRGAEVFRIAKDMFRYGKRLGANQDHVGLLNEQRFGIQEFGNDPSFSVLQYKSRRCRIAFHPTLPLLVLATDEGFELWNTQTNAVITKLSIGSTLSALFSPDGSRLYSSGTGGIREWPLEYHDEGSGSVQFGTPTVLLSIEDLEDRAGVKISHRPVFERLSLDRTGRWMSIDCGPILAVVMDFHRDNQLQVLCHKGPPTHQDDIDYASISPDGKWAVTSTWMGKDVWVWDAQTGEFVTKLVEGLGAAAVAFSPDGKSLAVSSKEALAIWDVEGWEVQHRFPREVKDWPGGVDYSPDGRLLVSAYDRSSLQLRDAQSGARLAIIRAAGKSDFKKVKFSPDSSTLAVVSNGAILQWDMTAIRDKLDQTGVGWDD